MWRRALLCLIFATWCFLNTWVELAEGRISYFARFDPLRTTVLPVLCWEIVIALGLLGIWGYCKRFSKSPLESPRRRLSEHLP